MKFLSIFQRLAHHYLGWDYVVFPYGYGIQCKLAFAHEGKIYVKISDGYKEIEQSEIIFTTIY